MDFRQISLVNDFMWTTSWRLGGQEPGTNEEIQQFCQVKYGVTFPVLAKIDVNGDNMDPVYNYLKKHKSGILGLSRVKYVHWIFIANPLGGISYVLFNIRLMF